MLSNEYYIAAAAERHGLGLAQFIGELLRTIGGNLDSTEKGKLVMDVYVARINTMIETPDLPSRLKFMLMDIVDLQRKQWVSKENNKGPKTLEEVRAEEGIKHLRLNFITVNSV